MKWFTKRRIGMTALTGYAVLRFLWFLTHVEAMAQKHTDAHVSYAMGFCVIGVVLLAAAAVFWRKRRRQPVDMFVLSWLLTALLYMGLGLAALRIASQTPCCVGG